jgi:hypothetical protein
MTVVDINGLTDHKIVIKDKFHPPGDVLNVRIR